MEPGEDFHEGAVREMFEETGLKLEPIKVAEAFEKPYFTTIGMTDESCATVYGYASGEVSKAAQEDSEEIEVAWTQSGQLYHLYHPRGASSSYQSKDDADRLRRELVKICSMDKETLISYLLK